MLAGVMSRWITSRRCMPGHRAGQRHGQPDEVVRGQRFGQSRQARVAGVRQHDRPRVPHARRQLGDPCDTTQPGQHGYLMLQPACRIRP